MCPWWNDNCLPGILNTKLIRINRATVAVTSWEGVTFSDNNKVQLLEKNPIRFGTRLLGWIWKVSKPPEFIFIFLKSLFRRHLALLTLLHRSNIQVNYFLIFSFMQCYRIWILLKWFQLRTLFMLTRNRYPW